VKLKKTLKTLSSGQKNLKKPKKTQKTQKKTNKPKKTHWAGFLKKPGFFPTLLEREARVGEEPNHAPRRRDSLVLYKSFNYPW
jgi:hypothetical protein